MTENRGVWLHAVTRDVDHGKLAGLAGVGGGSVRAVEADGLAGVVSTVDLTEYDEQALRRNLEDLAWLEATAREHHGVVDAVSRLGPSVPTRLATVYRDEARLRRELARRRADFVAALDRVAGRAEWGVKAYAVAASAPAEPATVPGPVGASGPGADYLRRRRAQLSAQQERQEAAVDKAETVHATLGRTAEMARLHAPHDRGLSGEAGWMVLNGAYLVDAGRTAEFTATVSGLAERHPALRLQLTGPWPAYSFTAVRDGEAQP